VQLDSPLDQGAIQAGDRVRAVGQAPTAAGRPDARACGRGYWYVARTAYPRSTGYTVELTASLSDDCQAIRGLQARPRLSPWRKQSGGRWRSNAVLARARGLAGPGALRPAQCDDRRDATDAEGIARAKNKNGVCVCVCKKSGEEPQNCCFGFSTEHELYVHAMSLDFT
jgi:hypothetical protein